MGHHSCCNQQKVRRGLWSPEEDEKLINYITTHGYSCWSEVPLKAGLQRCGKSCRLRWINYLRPDIRRGRITPEEEKLIISLHAIVGNRWAHIASHLPGRTDNEIKNYWNSWIKKKIRKPAVLNDRVLTGETLFLNSMSQTSTSNPVLDPMLPSPWPLFMFDDPASSSRSASSCGGMIEEQVRTLTKSRSVDDDLLYCSSSSVNPNPNYHKQDGGGVLMAQQQQQLLLPPLLDQLLANKYAGVECGSLPSLVDDMDEKKAPAAASNEWASMTQQCPGFLTWDDIDVQSDINGGGEEVFLASVDPSSVGGAMDDASFPLPW